MFFASQMGQKGAYHFTIEAGLAPILIILLIAAATFGYLIYSGKINLNSTGQPKPTPAYIRPADNSTMGKPNSSDETANWKIESLDPFSVEWTLNYKYPTD